MKYVINKCYGGFGLSEKALRRLHELGCKEISMPVEKYYRNSKDMEKAINNAKNKTNSLFKTVFSDDFTLVLYDGFRSENRNHPLLVQVVEELGEDANGDFAVLEIVEVPVGVPVEITDYDGIESIREASRYFG